MGTFSQLLEEQSPRPTKRSRLTVNIPWREFMPPEPASSLLEIFGELEFKGQTFGIQKTPLSPSPASTPTPSLSSLDISQFDSKEIQQVGEVAPARIEVCRRRRCLRCNPDVGLQVLGVGFPPPISSIGRNGKPWVQYESIKQEGRFVLKEIRVPGRQCMHATRENGHLLLQLDNPNSSDE